MSDEPTATLPTADAPPTPAADKPPRPLVGAAKAAAERKAARVAAGGGNEPRRPGRPSNRDRLIEQVTGTLAMVGMTVSAFDRFDGAVVLEHSANVATAIVDLAESNPAVKRAIEAAVSASNWSGLVLALGTMLVPILAHHGVLPPQLMAMAPSAMEQAGIDLSAAEGSSGLADVAEMLRRPAA